MGWVCTICPYPMIMEDRMPGISCQVCPLKCISIVDASRMAKTIINNEQIMQHNNQLCHMNLQRCRSRYNTPGN